VTELKRESGEDEVIINGYYRINERTMKSGKE